MPYSSSDVTVIVPYFNEQLSIEQTLGALNIQTQRPAAIFLVNSSSSDETSAVVDAWILSNAGGKLFFNLHLGTTTPGGSKQQGVRLVRTSLVAFMDCGLTFSSHWIEDQLECMNRSGAEFVSGVCHTVGFSIIDRSAIAHTYGANQRRPVIPSSVINLRLFDYVGEFLDLRASYDSYWVKQARNLGVRREVNEKVVVRYVGVNFAATLGKVFAKSITYARPAIQRPTLIPYIYFISAIAVMTTAVLAPSVIAPLTLGYVIARLALAIVKSRCGIIRFLRPDRLIVLVVTGAALDLGKLVGYTRGFLDQVWNQKLS